MSRQNAFDGLSEFLAIAKRQSIRKAALDLEVTPGAISQALQKLGGAWESRSSTNKRDNAFLVDANESVRSEGRDGCSGEAWAKREIDNETAASSNAGFKKMAAQAWSGDRLT
ncbi:hypothetical protein J2W42_006707 [Rhizobium tibeticum]|uniref:LysR family transcriptional regulator n=1 Tax=Rhizobium tibeticum TaxID=501024 RepID=UPI002782AFB4|nr:LysR family transcriptional regulator [Rhizobium tibeticum]MDP9813831.1 hypothetical protein [Rhizobium tibeticum]